MPSPLDIVLGKVGNNGHPLHPAFVHYPLTFLLAACFLDILCYIGLQNPAILYPITSLLTTSTHPNYTDESAVLGMMSLFSYFCNLAALLTSLPALITGGAEAYAMISSRGLDFKNLDPTVRTTLIHAGLNDVAVLGAVYNWLTKRGVEGYVVSGGNVLVSALTMGGVMYSAYLGGALVYERGVGVQRMGAGKAQRQKMVEEAKEKGKKEL